MTNDTWTLGGHEFHSRFILGSGKYSLDLIKAAVEQAGAEILTLALRRAIGVDHSPAPVRPDFEQDRFGPCPAFLLGKAGIFGVGPDACGQRVLRQCRARRHERERQGKAGR